MCALQFTIFLCSCKIFSINYWRYKENYVQYYQLKGIFVGARIRGHDEYLSKYLKLISSILSCSPSLNIRIFFAHSCMYNTIDGQYRYTLAGTMLQQNIHTYVYTTINYYTVEDNIFIVLLHFMASTDYYIETPNISGFMHVFARALSTGCDGQYFTQPLLPKVVYACHGYYSILKIFSTVFRHRFTSQ